MHQPILGHRAKAHLQRNSKSVVLEPKTTPFALRERCCFLVTTTKQASPSMDFLGGQHLHASIHSKFRQTLTHVSRSLPSSHESTYQDAPEEHRPNKTGGKSLVTRSEE